MSQADSFDPVLAAGIHIQRARDVALTAGGDIVAGNKTTIHRYYGPKPRDLTKAPYKFLSYYDIGDRDIFFGRDAVIEEIAGEIPRHRILIINGQSGSGKTSLINAGLIPRLAENGYLYVYFRDYANPLEQVREYFRDHAEFGVTTVDQLSLLQILRSIRQRHGGRVVVVFDQFERFLVSVPEDLRRRFLDEIRNCLESDLPTDELNLVFSLRDDFYGKLLLEAEAVIPSFGTESHHHNLRTLNRGEARQAILLPLKDIPNIGFDGKFVDDILLPHLIGQASGVAAIEPPHLQIVCNQMYESARERYRQQLEDGEPVRIGFELYHELGETEGMLRDYLDDVVRRITASDARQTVIVQTAVVRSILKLMIATVGTRRFRSLRELAAEMPDVPPGETERVVQKLQDARVLEAKSTGTETVFSLSHEFMVAKVQSWYDEREMQRRKAIETAERSLVEFRSSGALLNPNQLDHLERWLTPERMTNDVRELIAASARELQQQALHRQQQQQRVWFWKRGGLVVAVVLTLISVVFGIWGSRNARQATLASQDSRRQARTSEARRLAAESQIARQQFPIRALLLADAAVAATAEDGVYLSVAEQALRDALGQASGTRLPGHVLAHDPAGRQIATADDAGRIRIWHLDDLSRTTAEFSFDGPVTSLAVSPDWLAACDHGAGKLWNLRQPGQPAQAFHGDEIEALSSRAMVFRQQGGDRPTGYQLLSLESFPPANSVVLGDRVVLSDDRKWLGATSYETGIRLWNLQRPAEPIQVAVPEEQAELLAVGGTGCCLISVKSEFDANGQDPTRYMLTHPNEQGGPLELPYKPRPGIKVLAPAGRIRAVAPLAAFAADGSQVAASGDIADVDELFAIAADVRHWNVDHPEESPTYAGHPEMLAMTFAGDRLVTSGSGICAWTRDSNPTGQFRRTPLPGSQADDTLLEGSSRYIVAQAKSHALRVWNIDALDAPPRELFGLEAPAQSFVVDDAGSLLLASDPAGIRVWNLAARIIGQEPQRPEMYGSAKRLFLAAATDGQFYVRGSRSFWHAQVDAQGHMALRDLFGSDTNSKFRTDSAQVIAASPDGQWCAAVGGYHRAGVLVQQQGNPQWIPTIGGAHYGTARFSQDGRWLIADADSTGGVWRGGSVVWKVGSPVVPVRFFATKAVLDQNVSLEQPETEMAMVSDFSLMLQDTRIDIAGDWMLLSRGAERPTLWNLAGEVPELFADVPAFLQQDNLRRLGGQGRWLLFQTTEAVQLWDLSDPQAEPLHLPAQLGPAIASVPWAPAMGLGSDERQVLQASPDDRWFVVAAGEQYAFWRLQSAKLSEVELDVPIATADDLRFTPEGRWLVSWNDQRPDFQARRLDGDSIGTPASFRGHSTGIRDLVTTAEGILVSTSADGEVRLWDLHDPAWGSVLLGGTASEGVNLEIAPDARCLLTASGNQLQAWRLWQPGTTGPERIEPLRQLAREAAGRLLSEAERNQYGLPEPVGEGQDDDP